jgi:predicted DsbA family dithiol-disulfide isomerase
MRIDVFADLVCPWCYIGKKRLERAVAARRDVPVEIQWHPFQLNPDLPAEGVEAAAFFAAKFGSAGRVEQARATVSEIGAALGIDFAFARITREPNTLDGHRLTRYAAARGRADDVVEALFHAHFVAGRDLGDRATLAVIAGEAGLDPSQTRAFLDSDAERDSVMTEEQGARKLGINAVPCYIFERQYAVSGAQEPEFFLPIFDLVQNGAKAPSA